MNVHRGFLASLLVAVVVMNLVAGPVAAQGASSSGVLLDSGREKVETVQMSGNTYEIYAYENMLPYASGLEVYQNGQRVANEGEVRRVLQRVAWKRATGRLGPEDIETLRQIDDQVQNINNVITPTLEVVNRIVSTMDQLKQTSVMGTSAWSLVTQASPTLKSVDAAARSLQTELQEWKAATEQVNNNVPQVIESLERMENGESVDYEQVSAQFQSAMQGLAELQEKSAAVSERLATASEGSSRAASEVRTVPVVGGELSSFLGDVSGSLSGASSEVGKFGEVMGQQRSQLAYVRSAAESEEQQLMSAWKARQSAEEKVYGTVGGGGVLSGMMVLLLVRRLR